MNKRFFLGVAGLVIAIAGPAVAADLPVAPVKAARFAARFSWTGCYLGAHVGGAWERKDATDPVLLVQEGLLPGNTVGTTTVRVNSTGPMYGGQIGCDSSARSILRRRR